MAADALEALVTHLRGSVALTALLSARIYRPELPAAEATAMPRATLVLTRAGGGVLIGFDSYLQVHDERIDVIAYGGSPAEAAAVQRAAWVELKQLVRVVSEGTLVHWARPEQAPMSLRDPDTEWPLERSSWQVLVSEVEVS